MLYEMMVEYIWIIFIVAVIVIWGIVGIAWCWENKKYKLSSYGKQSKNSFF